MMEQFLLDNWLSLAIVCIQAVWGWLLWSLRKQFISAEEHAESRKQIDARMDGIENKADALAHRVDMVEREVRALPATEKGMNDLGIAMERVRGELVGLRAEVAGQRDSMKAIERQLSLLMENELRGNRDGS
jgi:hypothetical protein